MFSEEYYTAKKEIEEIEKKLKSPQSELKTK